MQRIPVTPEQLLTDIELAKYYGVSVATLRKWRILGKGPRWIKLGAALVRYRISDVNAFLETCPAGPEVPTGSKASSNGEGAGDHADALSKGTTNAPEKEQFANYHIQDQPSKTAV